MTAELWGWCFAGTHGSGGIGGDIYDHPNLVCMLDGIC